MKAKKKFMRDATSPSCFARNARNTFTYNHYNDQTGSDGKKNKTFFFRADIPNAFGVSKVITLGSFCNIGRIANRSAKIEKIMKNNFFGHFFGQKLSRPTGTPA